MNRSPFRRSQMLPACNRATSVVFSKATWEPPFWNTCICQDWDKKNFIFFCTYSIKSLLIFKVQNSLLLLTFSLLPIEEASSFFTTGFLYYSFCLLHCISDKVLTLKHNLYIFVVVNEHLINYVGKYISVILFQHTILG